MVWNNWVRWLEVIGLVYIAGYTITTVYLRAKDINLNRKSYGNTYTNGLAWPFVVLNIPVWIVESLAQLTAKYMGRRDAKERQNKLNKVS